MAVPSTSTKIPNRKDVVSQGFLKGRLTDKHSLKKLCDNEIASLLKSETNENQSTSSFASASYSQKDKKFNFAVLEDSQNEKNSSKKEVKKTRTLSFDVSTQSEKENISTNILHGVFLQRKDCGEKTIPIPPYLTRFKKTQLKQNAQNNTDAPSTSTRETNSRSRIVEEFAKQRPISPILPNPCVDPNMLICGALKKPKRIKWRSARTPKPHINFSETFFPPQYDEEYIDDILANSKKAEKLAVLPTTFLDEFNPSRKNRKLLVNWLLTVQCLLDLNESEFYVAVGLFDRVLAKIFVPVNMCQLAAIASLLISCKYNGVENSVTPRTLLGLCLDIYSEELLLNMEEKILKLVDFRIQSVEPSVLVNIYLKKLQIGLNFSATAAVYFVLDCAIHIDHFSAIPASISSASAVMVAIKVFQRHLFPTVKKYFVDTLSKEEMQSCDFFYLDIMNQINELKIDNIHETIINKYKKYEWLSIIASSREFDNSTRS